MENFPSPQITSTSFILAVIFLTMIEDSRSSSSPLGEDLETRLCKKTAYFDLCMIILFPDTRKYSADSKGLAKMVMERDLIVSKEILSEAQRFAHDHHKTRRLRAKCGKCASEYKAIVFSLIPGANRAIDSCKYGVAIQELKYAANKARASDDEFSKGKGKVNDTSPIVNMSVHDISVVAIDILKTMHVV